MSRKKRQSTRAGESHPAKPPTAPSSTSSGKRGSGRMWGAGIALVLLVAVGAAILLPPKEEAVAKAPAPPEITGPVTFSEHVAPIIFENCSLCHRPGESGPFPLLNYADVKKHAEDIVEVTQKRLMPPWLPEPGHGDFEGDRRLPIHQLATIKRWVDEGAVEGDSAKLPPLPEWKGGWQLGEPDLVVEPSAYELPAEGRDVYYNLVVPIPADRTRFVEAVEFLPGNRTVHHAFVNIDETRGARRLSAKRSPPGFPGMDMPDSVVMPGGQLLGWQPGKIPRFSPPGLAWVLRTNTDLVLQLHMNPSGKIEQVQPRVGFHFTDTPPTNSSFRIRLTSLKLDIPAGMSNYVSEQSYTLPVDVSMIRVGAHAHYLAKDMQGFAILPDGTKRWLLWIKDWDFKWQGDYQYNEPVRLPKGSKIVMRFTYDNSAKNVRNPHHPPRRVLWGLGSEDEMGELYFQALPGNREDYQKLGMHYSQYFMQTSIDFYRFRVELNPDDAEFHQRLGRAYASTGEMDRGETHLKEAIRLNRDHELAYFDLGSIYLRQKKFREAALAFEEVVRLNPEDSQAYGSLGIIALQTGQLAFARQFLETAVRLNPEDALAAKYLSALNAAERR